MNSFSFLLLSIYFYCIFTYVRMCGRVELELQVVIGWELNLGLQQVLWPLGRLSRPLILFRCQIRTVVSSSLDKGRDGE